MNIRFMTEEDIIQVAAIEAACFSMPWSQKAFAESLAAPTACFLVAEERKDEKDGGQVIVGYIGCYLVAGEGEVTNVAVRKEYRRRGIAEIMMKELLCIAAERGTEQMLLEVRESNTAACSLYEKCGFKKAGMRKNFYEKPRENAVIMVLQNL